MAPTPMEDSNQIEVPPSFLALFTPPGGHRLTEPMRTVRARYELCEDLSQMLAEQAPTVLFKSGSGEREVLMKMKAVLSGAGVDLQPREAAWVMTRLAELLGWELPAAD